jgi:hypothetical protein
MLTSQLGIHLILLMGKTVPVPAPYSVSSALVSVEITNDTEQGDGFQMTFTMGKNLTGEYNLLLSGLLDLFTRVVIGVALGAIPEVLIDGVITHHQIAPSSEPGMSTLTVTGQDISIMLDLQEKNESYEHQSDSSIVTRVIANYAQYRLLPQVTPTEDVPSMLQRIPRQHETDLEYIQRLAQNNGFVFYIEPVEFGVNTAYWGPENRLGIPQPALTINMGTTTNLKSLYFSQDALAPVATQGTFLEPAAKTTIPVSPLPSLRVPPLAVRPTSARRTVLLRNTANQNPLQAATTARAAVMRAPDSVTGEGELNTIYYGHILRARKLVGVRGAGLSYDGNYKVLRVTHTIARGEYTQRFSLSREGTGSPLPVIRP